MSAELATKACRMCCMEIPAQARKCPHCHHFQDRKSMVMYHPVFGVLFAALPMFGFLAALAHLFSQGEDFQRYANQIEITGSRLAFGDTKSGTTIAVIGTITNTSPVPWKEILYHADFFDAQGSRMDVGERMEYSSYLPANGAISFKVSYRREFPETNYVTHRVSVLSAKDGRSRW